MRCMSSLRPETALLTAALTNLCSLGVGTPPFFSVMERRSNPCGFLNACRATGATATVTFAAVSVSTTLPPASQLKPENKAEQAEGVEAAHAKQATGGIQVLDVASCLGARHLQQEQQCSLLLWRDCQMQPCHSADHHLAAAHVRLAELRMSHVALLSALPGACWPAA